MGTAIDNPVLKEYFELSHRRYKSICREGEELELDSFISKLALAMSQQCGFDSRNRNNWTNPFPPMEQSKIKDTWEVGNGE